MRPILGITLHSFGPIGAEPTWAQIRTSKSKKRVDYFVSIKGRDTNDGSQQRPWATLTHAAKIIGPGSTVHVAAGVYTGPVSTDAFGTSSARIRYVSDVKRAAVIAITDRTAFAWRNTGAYVDVDGFEITGNAATGFYSTGPFNSVVNNHVHHLIPSCDGNGGSGITLANGAHDGIIANNVVHHVRIPNGCTTSHGVGIYIQTRAAIVYNNLVFLNGGQGIQMWHGATAGTISKNTIFSNAKEGILVGCGDSGCAPPGPVQNDETVVINNISIYNDYGIREFGSTGIHNRYSNNMLVRNTRDIALRSGGIAIGTIAIDPSQVFINWKPDGNGDYRFRPGSPVLHAGTPGCHPIQDPEAKTPCSERPNIGAELDIPTAPSPR